jgi:hypothetical protein
MRRSPFYALLVAGLALGGRVPRVAAGVRVDRLRFTGTVTSGAGLFAAELRLPGRDRLSVPIRDWPEVPVAGTLNVRIGRQGFPIEYLVGFGTPSFDCLDSRRFLPEAELPWTDIGNNTLPPTTEQPDRGRAQVWRAALRNRATGESRQCWVLRRVGSAITSSLEVVAAEHLRSALALRTGSPVRLTMEGRWVERPWRAWWRRSWEPDGGRRGIG